MFGFALIEVFGALFFLVLAICIIPFLVGAMLPTYRVRFYNQKWNLEYKPDLFGWEYEVAFSDVNEQTVRDKARSALRATKPLPQYISDMEDKSHFHGNGPGPARQGVKQ